MKAVKYRYIKVLYILSSIIYLWAFYFLGMTAFLNLYLPKRIAFRNAVLNYTTIWSTGIFKARLRNVSLEIEGKKYARIKSDYITVRFNPLLLFKDHIVIDSVEIDGFMINYRRGVITKLDGEEAATDNSLNRYPGKWDKNIYRFPSYKTVSVKNIKIREIKSLDSDYFNLSDNLEISLGLEIDDKIVLSCFSMKFLNSTAFLKKSDTKVVTGLNGMLYHEKRSAVPLEDFLFSDDNAYRLKIRGHLCKSYFSKRKESLKPVYEIIGGNGEIECDLQFRRNNILDIYTCKIVSSLFKIKYQDFMLSGLTKINVNKKADKSEILIEMTDISMSQHNTVKSYPDGTARVEIFSPSLLLDNIAFITPESYGSISIKKGKNDPFSFYQLFRGNEKISRKEMAEYIFNGFSFSGKALF